MINCDEDALYCDFVETYHITDYRALPPYQAARLASGLRDDSRIKSKLSGYDITLNTALMAAMLDCLKILIWQNTKDGHKNINKPESTVDLLTKKEKNDVMGYRTPEEFEAAWKAATEK